MKKALCAWDDAVQFFIGLATVTLCSEAFEEDVRLIIVVVNAKLMCPDFVELYVVLRGIWGHSFKL